ncbi:MAG: hypothetical protein ER33_15175 [Cyanobium sp. CACIAM 14]|nr:MAG: hypothetical protein ER33_15175 [Cyanobium sp. CACIAM 14]
MNPDPWLVFVYGTLKRGCANHRWLAGCGFEGEASVSGLVLHDLGPFPMAIPGDGVVRGEVYRLEASTLAGLDRLEGYPRLYDRQPMPLGDGRWAWVYVGRPRQVRFVPALPDGRWPGGGTAGPRTILLGAVLAVLLTALLKGAGGLPGALAQGLPPSGAVGASCQAWQRATGEEKVRIGNALGAAHYLTRRHLVPASAADGPETPPVSLYGSADLRRLCSDR